MARSTLAINYQCADPTLYEDFATIGQWTAGGSAGSTATADATNTEEGATALKLDVAATAGGNAFATKTINTNFDTLRIARFVLRIYVADPALVSSTAIYISSSSSLASYMLATTSAGFSVGWNSIVLHRNDFSATGGEVWSNTMIRIRVRLNAAASSLPAVTFGSLKYGGRTHANICFTFDDAFDSVYTEAFPYMSAAGLVGTIYVNGSSIGTAGYCTVAQLLEMQSAGWVICNHVYTHTNLTTVDVATQRSLIQQNIDWLIANGFEDGAYHLAYPNGGHDDAIIALVQSMGFKTARTITEWANRGQHFPLESLYRLKIGNCLHTSSSATVIGWLDDAARKGATIILLYHQLVESASVSTQHNISSFQAEVGEAVVLKRQGRATVRSILGWYRGMKNPRDGLS